MLPYRLYFLLALLQALIVVGWLVRIPVDPKNVIFLGFSASRWMMIIGGLLVGAVGGFLFWKAMVDLSWMDNQTRELRAWLSHRRRWGKILLLSFVAALLCGVMLLAIERASFYVLAPPLARGISEVVDAYYVDLAFRKVWLYLERLQPFFALFLGLSLQTLILLPLMRFRRDKLAGALGGRNIYLIGGLYGLALVLWGLLGGLQLKLEQDVLGWNSQTAPVTDTHLTLAVILGIGLLLLLWRTDVTLPRFRVSVDVIIFGLIWVAAALYWQSIPLRSSWYLSPPRAPNYEFYPNSDAMVYDRTAASLASGAGFRTYTDPTIVRRPMYTFFLSLLHLAADGEYESVLALQSILLAVFPALAYLAGKDLSNRISGIMAAALLTLREGTSLAIADHITISHSKLSMSDFPTAVGAILFSILIFRGLQTRQKGHIYFLSAGGVLGMFTLIRSELSILLLAALLVAGLTMYGSWKRWAQRGGLLVLGAVLLLTPWLIRNWHLTGRLYLEVPGNRLNFLITRMRFIPADPPRQGPEELLPELDGSAATPEHGEPGLLSSSRAGTWGNARPSTLQVREAFPQETAGDKGILTRTRNHFLHSNVQMVLALPNIYRGLDAAVGATQHQSFKRFYGACCEPLDYIRRLPYWQWYEWEGELPTESAPLIFVNLLLLAVGIGRAWASHSWKGLLPLLFAEVYVFIQAVARTSGGRYIFPVDWAFLLYYAVGLAQILIWALRLIKGSGAAWLTAGSMEAVQAGDENGSPSRRAYVALVAGMLLIGISLPAAEAVIPRDYTEGSLEARLKELYELKPAPEAVAVMTDLMDGNGEVLVGRAYYPRFYEAGIGEPGESNEFVRARDYRRLSFLLVGQKINGVVLSLERFPTIEIPNGVEVIVAGCQKKEHLEAAVLFITENGQAVERSAVSTDGSCPLPPVE